MKKILNVLVILVLTVFVSGYKYDVVIEVDDKNQVTLTETYKIEDNQSLIERVCGCKNSCQCDLSKERVENTLKHFFDDKNAFYEDLKYDLQIHYDGSGEKADYSCKYELGDIDNNVGGKNNGFSLYGLSFNNKIFTVSGSNYYLNVKHYPDIYTDIETTLTLKLPVIVDYSNATKASLDMKTLTWTLNEKKDIKANFKIDNKIEDVVKDDYKKIQTNKIIMILAGVVGGIIVIIIFINIIKNSKKAEVEIEKDNNREKFLVNDVFNANANIVKNDEQSNIPVNVMSVEEIKNHEDIISNKFLDTSFSGISSSDTNEDNLNKNEEQIDKVKTEENIMNDTIGDIQSESSSVSTEITESSSMSSVAFGGTPIEDKNINEIK